MLTPCPFSVCGVSLDYTLSVFIVQVIVCYFLLQAMALMSTQATGLPPGIFECSLEQWKRIRHVTLPAFTNTKLRMVMRSLFSLPTELT